jgi:hypothetical protein
MKIGMDSAYVHIGAFLLPFLYASIVSLFYIRLIDILMR